MLQKTSLMLLAALTFACGGPPPVKPPVGAIATWTGGSLGLDEVESAFANARIPACRQARRGGELEQLIPCYRELTEGLALESLVLEEITDVDRALEQLGEDGDEYRQLRRHAFVDAYLQRLQEEIEVDDAEIEARFQADPERFRHPGQLSLSNIFRRHADPTRPEETEAFLRTLKERFEAGETFAALAREHSHSETRLRGGEVGRVSENDLPERLRQVAFALDDGEVSEPVRVKGGAVLLFVQGIIEGIEPEIQRARGQIRRELTTERVEQAITDQVADREPPEGSLLLSLDELITALDGDDPDAIVLEIGDDSLSVDQFRRLAGLAPRALAGNLDAEERDRLSKVYYRQRERSLLALQLLDSADPELTAEAEEHLREEAVSRLVDQRIEDELARQVEGQEEQLKSYYDDNQHHYQSPLRFKLRKWNLPFDDDPPSQMRRMESLREQLVAGELQLAAAVAELGGNVEELDWRDFDSLADVVPDKARTYLMEVGDRGWSVPYQQDDELHLIELAEREEPAPLAYDEALERVREDYLKRFQQELYRRVAEERLKAAGFAFDEAMVRRLLAPEETHTTEATVDE